MGARNLNRFESGGKHVFKGFPFIRGELPQHVPRHAAPTLRGPDPHLQPGKILTTQMLDDGFDPVVPSRRSLFPKAEVPQRQRNIVINHQHPLGFPFEKRHKLPDRAAAEIHERLGLHEDGAIVELGNVRLEAWLRFEFHPVRRGDPIQKHEPHIMPGSLILPSGVPQSDYQ